MPKDKFKGKPKPGVKIDLRKLKNVCQGQLAPFEGLWGYRKDLDHFPGTIFRFPLRASDSKSKLRVNKKDLDVDVVRSLMGQYFKEARISLLFLRRINSIDFKIYGKPNTGWSISRQGPVDEDFVSFSDWMACSYTNDMDPEVPLTGIDKWWVAVEDLVPETSHLPFSPRRVMKNVECGIAALVTSKSNNSQPSPQAIQPQMFNVLPLPISSDLPVHIHATFSISGDRQSLIVDEHGQESHGSKWNRYLLETALPKLYLSFLDDLGGRIRKDTFSYWPREAPPKRSSSELLYSAFWQELAKSSKRLFPKFQFSTDLNQRRAPELFDISQAVFDFLPTQSDALAGLLLSLGVNLVRHIPPEISKHLTRLPEVNHVTGAMIRELVKLESTKPLLQNVISKFPTFVTLLLHLVIPSGEDLEELDGCYILHLANGTLGSLRLLNSSTTETTYYDASATEMKLFSFSSGLLLSSKARKPFEKVLNSKKFNLAKLELSHVGRLLKKRIAPESTNPQTDKWLTDFWKFWNDSPEADNPALENEIDNFMLYKATQHGGDEVYLKPSQFRVLGAIVKPLNDEHQLITGKIPGLYQFHSMYMPKILKQDERLSYNIPSFCRFITVLRDLAVMNGTGLGNFLKTHLNLEDLMVIIFSNELN